MKPTKAIITVFEPLADGDTKPRSHEAEPGTSLARALIDLSPDRWGNQHVEVFKGKYTEEHKIDLAQAPSIILEPGDRYIVAVLPAASLALAAVGASSFTSFLVSTAIGFGLTFLAAALRPTPPVGPTASLTEASPLNQLSPPRNRPRLGARIPDLYGSMRTWPDLVFPAIEEWGSIYDPSSGRVQRLRALYCVTNGDAEISQHYIGDTPLSSISGATVTVLKPGELIPSDFHLVRASATFQNIQTLMDQELPAGSTGYSNWIRLPGLGVSQIWVDFSLPNGSLAEEFKYGSSSAYAHRLQVECRTVDLTNGNIANYFLTDALVSVKSTSPFRYTFKIPVPYEEDLVWEARFKRVDNNLTKGDGGPAGVDLYRRGLTINTVSTMVILDAEARSDIGTTRVLLDFTNLAANAAATINGASRYNVVASRNLYPVSDAGALGTILEPTRRWIDAIVNMLTETATYPITELDLLSFVKVQRTMESRVADITEPAGQFNALYDTVISVDQQVSGAADMARASLFSDGAKVTAVVDADNRFDEFGDAISVSLIVKALFNRRNRSAKDIDTGIGARAALPTETDGVEVTWKDAASGWQHRTFLYTPSGSQEAFYPIRYNATGMVHWAQVYRHAAYLFNRSLFRRFTTSLNGFEECRLLQLYDTVSVVQPWREATIDGQIVDYDGGTEITVDADLSTLTVGSDTIRIRSVDGRQTEMFLINAADAGASTITLDSVPGFTILDAAALVDSQMGNLFIIYSDALEDAADDWRVLGINAQTYDGQLTMVNEDPRVFDGDKWLLPGAPEWTFNPGRAEPILQNECLSMWWYPSQDATLDARRTRFQEVDTFNFTGGSPSFSDCGIQINPKAQTIGIDTTTNPDFWDWWFEAPMEQYDDGIFYMELEIGADAHTQSASRAIMYFVFNNQNYVSFILGQDTVDSGDPAELRATINRNNSLSIHPTGVFISPSGGTYRIALAFTKGGPEPAELYVYASESIGTSQRGTITNTTMPLLEINLNLHLLGSSSFAGSPEGTLCLSDFRFYNCVPSEQFVADLAAGLVNEGPYFEEGL